MNNTTTWRIFIIAVNTIAPGIYTLGTNFSCYNHQIWNACSTRGRTDVEGTGQHAKWRPNADCLRYVHGLMDNERLPVKREHREGGEERRFRLPAVDVRETHPSALTLPDAADWTAPTVPVRD